MAQQRQYEPAMVFNARIVDMRHLWEPSREYKGQATQKPNYFAMFIVPKTQAQWTQEPALAGISQACGKIYQNNPHVVTWPVMDGDMPSPEGKTSEFAKGHWLFSASTGNAPKIELAQHGGALVPLAHKAGVKSGDHVMLGVTAAIKQNDPRGVKLYLNGVVFTGPGDEIVFANSISGAELMRQAQAQGLTITGFGPAPGMGGFNAPNPGAGGFNPGGSAPGGFNPGSAQQGGFQPTMGGFNPGAAPPQGFTPPGQNGAAPNNAAMQMAPVFGGAPGQSGPAGNGNVSFPSNGTPAFNPGGQFNR